MVCFVLRRGRGSVGDRRWFGLVQGEEKGIDRRLGRKLKLLDY